MFKLLRMNNTKDTIANLSSVVGTGGFLMGWNEGLTLVLILTGIALNVIRIYEIKRRNDNDESNS